MPDQPQNQPNDRPSKPVPLLDINRGNEAYLPEILRKVEQICRSGHFIGGPHCQELEQTVAAICNTGFAVGCASGSDALLLALMAIDLQPGDEVIVPSFTFFASVSAITRLGARPVFVDIDPLTYNMNPRLLNGLVTRKTRAIMPVHLFGQCCDMDAIRMVALEHDLHVIEDAAQAIGAGFKGEPACSMGSIGCISFYPTKNIGGFGDAGVVTCNNPQLADRLRLLANHGMRPRYYHDLVGVNSRLDAIQAAVLCSKLPGLEMCAVARTRNADLYRRLFTAAGLADVIALPESDSRCNHIWNQFTIRIPGGQRDHVRSQLTERGIGTEIYYPVPMHQQQCFRHIEYQPGSLGETEKAASEVLSLPIFPELTREEIESVVDKLASVLATESPLRRAA